MPGWMSYKLESRQVGETSTTSAMWMNTTLMAESKEELKSFLMRVKEESERAGLKLILKKIRPWYLAHYLMANKRGKDGWSDRFSLLGL